MEKAAGRFRGTLMKRCLILTLAVLFGLLQGTCNASAQKRVALLIGNQSYGASIGPLKNPLNDTGLVAQSLKDSGFETTIVRDATRIDILRALDRFATRVGAAGAGAISFFYYSGHGVARPNDHVNFIIPVDVKDMSDDDVWYTAVPLDSILSALTTNAPDASHFVVFDACRSELHVASREKGIETKAFAPMVGRNGQFVAFSTSPNETASDTGDAGGPYAIALASELRRPGQDHLQLFQNVRERVYSATQTRRPPQRPWETGSLLQRIFFSGAGTPMRAPPPERSPDDVDACLRNLDTKKLSVAESIESYKRCLTQS
jgi:uncharacterized caspase-like protein